MPAAPLTALCGKDASKPLAEYQSPQVLKLIAREYFLEEAAAFDKTHRGFFLVPLHELAATDIRAVKATHPERPIFLDQFYFDHGQAVAMRFLTLDYNGA